MRPSRVLKKLRNGEVVNCFKVNLACARAVEIAALAGFDCVWTDMEHVANDWSVIEQQSWAAKAHDVDLMVRVSRGGYSDHVRPLELDAAGIMVPHVMSLADAQNVVRMTRFHPIGRRPLDGGNADGEYCAIGLNEYMEWANDQRFVMIQIEDPEPLDELEQIAAIEGIDILFFGPTDMSQGLGSPGDWDNPRLLDAQKRVAEVAMAHGKYAATPAAGCNIEKLVNMGYRWFHLGADVVGLRTYCDGLLADFRAALDSLAGPAHEPLGSSRR